MLQKVKELEDFAIAFKEKRLMLGISQVQVGQALSQFRGMGISQLTISRFECRKMSFNVAQKLKPILEYWLEQSLKDGVPDRRKDGVNVDERQLDKEQETP